MPSAMRSFRIRTYPNAAQRRMLDRWFGASRWLWNTALGIRSEAYRNCGLTISGNDISCWLTQWKRTAGHEWLSDVPATCLRQCLRDQDAAFRNFFAKRAEYPRFKRRGTTGSLRFQDIGSAWMRGSVSLAKLGTLKLAEDLPEVSCPDMATLTRDATGRYHVSFCVQIELDALPITNRMIGVDLGLTSLATLSSGEKIINPKHYHTRLRYLRQQQRCLARRKNGSRRRDKQRLRVARAYAKVRDQRQNTIHRLTTRLVREFDLICIEDLNVKGMARGMHARSVHDSAFGEFRRQLTYKAAWYGRTLVSADRWFPSSKTCSRCRHVIEELRLNVRQWTCPRCGTEHDRDHNAALNLLADGIRQLAGRDGRDLRAEAGGAAKSVTLAAVPASEARSGRIVSECVEHE